ncbi:alpha/beta fold hydrolase [Streptomyces sp. NPDC058662]|uniref:alpha/beta fold hydrolase n=1 Tax=Streptomyces sp. NPDC058662 TaxID=3346583 RepID=UPI0036629690
MSGGAAGGRFVRVDGVPLHVVVEDGGGAGDRGPVCVLSAGLAMAWFDWDEVAARLTAAGRTVVRFDRPGHGLSGPAGAPATAAGEAHRIAALLDALGPAVADRPATVVGHSIAGFHAEAFARLHPHRTAALVLLDSSVEEHPPGWPARTPAAAALRTGAARLLGRAATVAGLPAALGPAARRATVRMSRTGGADPAPRDLVRRCYRTGRVWRGALLENAGYMDAAAEVLALRGTRPLTAPATVLAAYGGTLPAGLDPAGSGDRAAALRRAFAPGPGPSRGRTAPRWLTRQAELADRLGARLEVAERAGHLVMLDRPDQVAHAVLTAAAPAPG